MEELLEELCRRKGEQEGARIYRTILPGIMTDFNAMLKKAKVGTTISEEYRLDDGSEIVILEGERQVNGDINLRSHLQ